MKQKYNNILKATRLLALVVLMAFGAGLKGWGQTTIIEAGNRETVHTKTEIIYVDSNTPRVLSIPELKINDGYGDATYKWYVHWYNARGEIKGIDIYLTQEEATARGGSIRGGLYASDLRDAIDGLWWYDGFYGTGKNDKDQWAHLSSCASTIQYTAPADLGSEEEVLYCDVSNYTDYDVTQLTGANKDEGTFTEPTLLKRYKYIIRPASECADVLKKGQPLETYEIDYPAGSKNINFSMRSLPQNYFWYNGEGKLISGNKFKYSIGDAGYEDFTQYRYQVEQIDLSTYTSSVVVNVIAVSENGETSETSPILATYTFNPVKETGFKLEENVDESRKPELWEDLYEEIGIVDFDQDKVIPAIINPDDNLADKPMNSSETVYGFVFKDLPCLREFLTSSQNQYGLYRSANLPGISQSGLSGGGQYLYPYYFGSNKKYYKWIPPYMKAMEGDANVYLNTVLYDRTYARNGEYGFFYYIDASDDPGTLVDVPIKGTLCGQTELVVTAWVADMTRPKPTDTGAYPLPPNINLILKGKNPGTGEDEVLHFFTSGDALTAYNDNKINHNLMKWQQLYYRVVLPAEIDQYRDFHLEVQNNEPHTDGADYAIDDVRVYKTLPNIKVQREDACEADSLTVSSDYHTLLRNMAYSENSTTVTDWNSVVRRIDSEDGSEIIDVELLKYRLGLNGANDQNNFLRKETFDSYIFNSYFSFVEGLDDSRPDAETHDITSIDPTILGREELDPILLGPTDRETGADAGKDVCRWVRINKDLKKGFDPRVVFSYRTIVTTRAPQVVGNNVDNYPSTHEEAVKWERVFNLRALQDYNYLCNSWESFTDKLGSSIEKPDWLTNGITIQSGIFGEYLTVSDLSEIKNLPPMTTDEANAYDELMKTFWGRLTIPRIRVPWYDIKRDIMYLYTVDVRNTDLKSKGELVIEQDGTQKEATGQYHVVLHSASAIASGIGRTLNLKDICTLISPFTLYGSIQITVEAEADLSARACAGTQRKISAQLLSKDNGEPLTGVEYSFDWFLGGGYAKYWEISVDGYDLKSMLAAVRDDESFSGEITYANVDSWNPSSGTNQKIREKLLDLLNPEDAKLVTNKTKFSWLLSADSLVAMPFVTQGAANTSYCTEITAAPVPLYSTDVPELHPGFTLNGITYPFKGEVSLRLGRVNMGVNLKLAVPMQAGFEKSMAESASSLGLSDKSGVPIMLNNIEAKYPEIGLATNMSIMRDATDGTVTIQLNEEAKTYLQEGQRYELLIPFVQYDGSGRPLASECDGLISLPVKIVPEYLTWKGKSTDNWYDESKWSQSTKKELYFEGWDGKGADTDANGSDDIAKAFSPLYFTKITIPEETELALKSTEVEELTVGSKTYNVLISWDSSADSIRYEMAVANANGDIVPFYINKIDQIYFKPGATLLNQHLLTYKKARVDFEMTKGDPYWMSSPLKDVYAGDMYAPAGTGRQTTPAFDDITYKEENDYNSRWGLPFYQKAWNKAVTYSTKEDGTTSNDVEVVKSNWSIEYNDVWVPYTVGKGFYSRVENNDALVRLPKDDTEYGYETKALSTKPDSRQNSGKLHTDGTTDGTITLDLSSVDGDGNHFLIGNPYMAYLDMSKFFKTNTGLANKYWTLDNGTVIVGTPDVNWENGQSYGYIAPMQAFFVEREGYSTTETQADEGAANEDLTVTFNIDMTVAKPTSTEGETSTRAFKATNPQLTILTKGAEGKSVSFVVQSDFAENVYKSDEDAVALLDSELKIPMVYTVAGNCAAAVNKVKDMQNIPLGVYAEEDEEVEVTIEGMSQFVDSLYLHDALTGKSVLLDGDTYTLRVNGENHGRYTITTNGGITVESNICVYSPSSNNLMIAASPSETLEQVRVFDMSGRMVENRVDLGSSNCRLRIASGIYIVYAKTEAGETKVKVRVK